MADCTLMKSIEPAFCSELFLVIYSLMAEIGPMEEVLMLNLVADMHSESNVEIKLAKLMSTVEPKNLNRIEVSLLLGIDYNLLGLVQKAIVEPYSAVLSMKLD